MTINTLLKSLPQEPPFYFLHQVGEFDGQSVEGVLELESLPEEIKKGSPYLLTSFILEGLAQLSVIYVQLTTSPLKEGEFPLLGSMNFDHLSYVNWNVKQIELRIEGTKIHDNHAYVKAVASVKGKVICSGYLGLAKTWMEWNDE